MLQHTSSVLSTEFSRFQNLLLPRLQVDCTWLAAESRDFIAIVVTQLRRLHAYARTYCVRTMAFQCNPAFKESLHALTATTIDPADLLDRIVDWSVTAW